MDTEISKKIKFFRQANNMTQKELAIKLGVSQNAVHNWETGKRDVAIDMLAKMANIFNVTPSELMGWDGPKVIANYTIMDDTGKNLAFIESMPSVKSHENRTKAYNRIINYTKRLNKYGRIKLAEYAEDLSKIPEYRKDTTDHLQVNAAHERTDIEVTDEMRKHDEELMDDDNF